MQLPGACRSVSYQRNMAMLTCPACGWRTRCCATDCPNCATELEIDDAGPALTCEPRDVTYESWYRSEEEPYQ